MHKQLESQNKLLQQEVYKRQKKEARIRTLSRELMKAQENERQRISFELHDQIAQDIAMLKIGVDTLFDDQVKVPANMRERISEFSKLLKTVITAVRDLAYNLRSPLLEQFGLVRTVAQFCDDFSKKTGLRINFVHSNKLKGRFDLYTEVYLFRLTQEALNNIWKHADARHVRIELALASPTATLRIQDDGRGFDVENCLTTAQKDKRMGLRNMKERISLFGGEFHIQSSPMQGTKLFIEVPVIQKTDRDSPGYEP
jgi:signal transduction histidine kinase